MIQILYSTGIPISTQYCHFIFKIASHIASDSSPISISRLPTLVSKSEIEKFIFAAIETSAPYAVKIYELDQESMEAGRKKYRQALNEYAQCKASNIWPSYDQEIETIGIPQWALEKDAIEDFIFTEDE